MERKGKIGILTLCYGTNYGGTLQCMALQNVLQQMGYDVTVINYIKKEEMSLYKKITIKIASISSFRDIYRNLQDTLLKISDSCGSNVYSATNELKHAFELFRSKYIHLSSLVDENTIAEVANRMDAIVVGSDQVWGVMGANKLIYFLDWIPGYEGKRISYAACSTGFSIPPRFNRKKIFDNLRLFSAISVRDEDTQGLISAIVGNVPQIVADPTLLYHFEELLEPDMKIDEPYIFVYIIGTSIKGGTYEEIFGDIKKKYGDLKVVAVSIRSNFPELENMVDQIYYNASPKQWINLLLHASFVYTDSYHGILFSLKFEKQFIAYYTYVSRASRLLDLKSQFSLSNIVNSYMEFKKVLCKDVDYNTVCQRINVSLRQSLDFLEKAVELK